MTGEYLKLVIL